MKKILSIITLLLIVTLLFTQGNVFSHFFQPTTAYAVGDLQVDFGVPNGNPIFNITNFAPGQYEARMVTVKNNATLPRPVGIRGILITSQGSITNAFAITISQNGNDIYGGAKGEKTVTQFLNDTNLPNFISLGMLSPNTTVTYSIKVQFKSSAGNEFQNKTATFDIKIGEAFDVPASCMGKTFTNIVLGKANSEVINGTSGNDLIYGLEGSDAIDGKGGDDCIVGGTGNDVLKGSDGKDILLGDEGNDGIDGGNGDDGIYGGIGNDALNGEKGNDILDGQLGTDFANGGANNDTCVAEAKQSCEQ